MNWLIENSYNQLACIIEILMIFLCIHGVFKEEFRFSIPNIIIIISDLLVMALIDLDRISEFSVTIVYLALFVYCRHLFQRKMVQTVGLFLLSLVILGTIEIFASIIATGIALVFNVQESWMVLVNAVGLVITFTIFELPFIKNRINLRFDRERWGSLIVICSVSFVFLSIDYRHRGRVDQIYYFLFLAACVMTCIATMSVQKVKHEFEKHKLEIDMQEVYGDAYKELFLEMRRRQHDFSNQLAAIYSMHLTAKSLEDLVEKQSKYGSVILRESKFDKILTGCNNSILAGYLYQKCVLYDKENVHIEYQICVEQAKCELSLYEIIETLGILLTNAYESFANNEKEKNIRLLLKETTQSFVIEVSNVSPEITTVEIEKIFSVGYSSKGRHRGLGLGRVKDLVIKVNADLIVENRVVDGRNWICFKIVIPKKIEGE